ncbi:pyridine nucleotide-disulfide oxidoreductase [Sulfuracidifex tepidarius]|uniref:Sulfide-quinone reductase n=2 Tax=Sulfuracidifex tepidarius TaxID=1294262 RepID=A0A510DWJ2_9CREN|nr:pyridine nucleotide-disulfide oxidoreductase [Sulfuracidifex tepidarius]BBG24592.1 hypothetical protein IC006_1921 [Sulfuracidifex tepidarius]BBG27380.1 hypothetical protein IC007_1929 [Sulfuracidifex tepidarius]
MRVTILGGGYSGLNAFYNLNANINKKLISNSNKFTFYTAYLQHIINGANYISNINFVNINEVKEIDIERKEVKFSDGTTDNPDAMIIALGCNKGKIIKSIDTLFKKDNLSIQPESWRDEIVAIQLAFYLKRLGKNVSYSGDLLNWAGKNISSVVKEEMEKAQIKIVENADDVIPECQPLEEVGEFDYKTNFEIKKDIYAVGDLIRKWPRTGELAMRSGVFIGKHLSGKTKDNFKPILINIIDTGRGKAIHFRSDIPWGGNFESVKTSRVRALMKRFIEKHYVSSKGNMGFLYRL